MSDKTWKQIELEQCIFHPEYRKLEKRAEKAEERIKELEEGLEACHKHYNAEKASRKRFKAIVVGVGRGCQRTLETARSIAEVETEI